MTRKDINLIAEAFSSTKTFNEQSGGTIQSEFETKLADINLKISNVRRGFKPSGEAPIMEIETEEELKHELQSMKEWLEGMIANFGE